MGASIGAERTGHAIDRARILFGADYVSQNPVLYCVSNTNAPLMMDAHMSGAPSPCTVAGTLAQVLVEVMACLALVQLISPGGPCLMGSFASTM